MSTRYILDSYGIQMQNKINNKRPGVAVNDKFFLGGINMESFFNIAFNDPDEIDNEILSKIDYVINGNDPPLNAVDTSLGGIDTNAIIYNDAIRFHRKGTGEILQTVPIGDFNIIATAWRDFLKQNPLIGPSG